MTQSKIVIGGVVLAALVLGGCSGGPVQGTPTPGTSSAATSAASSDGPGATLAQVEPCTLLTNSEATTLGLPAGQPGKFGKQRECNFETPGTPQPVAGTVTIDPVFGFDQLKTPPDTDSTGIRKLTVDGRRVNYYPNNGGTLCTVNIEVNKTETVYVQINLRQGNTPEPPCAIAEKATGLVLPRMPKK